MFNQMFIDPEKQKVSEIDCSVWIARGDLKNRHVAPVFFTEESVYLVVWNTAQAQDFQKTVLFNFCLPPCIDLYPFASCPSVCFSLSLLYIAVILGLSNYISRVKCCYYICGHSFGRNFER